MRRRRYHRYGPFGHKPAPLYGFLVMAGRVINSGPLVAAILVVLGVLLLAAHSRGLL